MLVNNSANMSIPVITRLFIDYDKFSATAISHLWMPHPRKAEQAVIHKVMCVF